MPRYPVLDSLHHNGKAYGPGERLKTVDMAEDEAEGLVAAGVLGEPVKDKPPGGGKGKDKAGE